MDLPLPRKQKVNKNEMYEIEVVEEDDENDRVKIHYVGYSERYDEWRSRDDITIRPPDHTTSVQEPTTSPFVTLAWSRKNWYPVEKIQQSEFSYPSITPIGSCCTTAEREFTIIILTSMI